MVVEVKEKQWLGGLFDSDGCFGISKCTRKGGNIVYAPAVVITSKYSKLVSVVHDLFNRLEINHHIKKNGSCFNITIQRLSVIVKLHEILNFYVITKAAEFELLADFCRSRLVHENKRASYTEKEHNLYRDLSSLNEAHYGECLEYSISYEMVFPDQLEKLSLYWLAGEVDGDGEINIHKIDRPKGGFQLRSTITIVTGSPLTKNLVASLLDRYNIDYYLHKQLPGVRHKPNCRYKKFSFSIRKLDACVRVCELLEGKLVLKNKNLLVLKDFCSARQKNPLVKYSEQEIAYYNTIKGLLNDYT